MIIPHYNLFLTKIKLFQIELIIDCFFNRGNEFIEMFDLLAQGLTDAGIRLQTKTLKISASWEEVNTHWTYWVLLQ